MKIFSKETEMAMIKLERLMRYIPAKYKDRIEGFDHDVDGYWLDLKYGWCWDSKGLHVIHEDSIKECLSCLRNIQPCDCKECPQS